jgi:spermidine synthase
MLRNLAKCARLQLMGIFICIFFLSGAAALGYQVVWAKAFAAGIGHEYPAVLAVITAFMTGMMLGNAALARRRTIGTKWYGWMEIVIGVWGLASVSFNDAFARVVTSMLGETPGPVFQWTVVFGAVLVLLLPATTAMGATLPTAERFLARSTRGEVTGLLYGVNTAGAMIGALAAAFWCMPNYGIRKTLIGFALVNLLCGFGALMLAARTKDVRNEVRESQRMPRELLARLFACGLLGIGFEVVMIRGLVHVLENTVYTFAVTLGVFLLGTALGALIIHRAQRKGRKVDANLLIGLLGISCAVAVMALRWSGALYVALRSGLGDSLAVVALAESLVAAVCFLVPTILMGAVWTVFAQESLAYKPSLAAAVAVNTAGAALAPVAFGLIAIPWLGLKWALAILPVGYALCGGARRWVWVAFAMVLAVFATSVRELIDTAGGRVISLREGVMGSVAVIEYASGERVMKFNNRLQMGGTASRSAEARQAQIPLLLHPGPKRALFIGLGTGITFSAAEAFQGLKADGVELVPEIVEVIPLFEEKGRAEGANLRTVIADGRRFVRATREKYDVIVSDLFHPAQDGAGFLYTREHFAAIRARLADGGVFCQWLPVYQMETETLKIVMATFASAFPKGELWLLRFNVDVPVIGLIARTGGERFDAETMEKRLHAEGLVQEMKRAGLSDGVRLLGCYVGEVKAGAEINTDEDPLVIFRAPALTFRKKDDPGARLLELIKEFSSAPTKLIAKSDADFATKVTKFIQARDVYLVGLQREGAGDPAGALASYIESARISEEFTASYAQALAFATALARERPVQSKAILKQLIEARPERPVAAQLLERISGSGE